MMLVKEAAIVRTGIQYACALAKLDPRLDENFADGTRQHDPHSYSSPTGSFCLLLVYIHGVQV